MKASDPFSSATECAGSVKLLHLYALALNRNGQLIAFPHVEQASRLEGMTILHREALRWQHARQHGRVQPGRRGGREARKFVMSCRKRPRISSSRNDDFDGPEEQSVQHIAQSGR